MTSGRVVRVADQRTVVAPLHGETLTEILDRTAVPPELDVTCPCQIFRVF
jgi:hypothetical protein